MRIRRKTGFRYGFNSFTKIDGRHGEMLMDFDILRMKANKEIEDPENKERAFLLISGEADFEWGGAAKRIKRDSCFDEAPSCLHVCSGVKVRIGCVRNDTEIAVIKTLNEKMLHSRFYSPDECRSEERGKGTLKETSTRIVRTIFDASNARDSRLVLGEVVDFPGKWSSYPPHHHPQPEIYFYKFFPENGFGHSELGEDVYKVRNNDAILIHENLTHSQVAAPGYAMYYIWVIRHLENNRYVNPTFVPEHAWVMEKDAVIWPDKK